MVYLILGYFANERWLYQQVLDRKLAPEPQREEFDDEDDYISAVQGHRLRTMRLIADILRCEIGIPELRLRVAWVARTGSMFSWQLPERMRTTRRMPEDDDKLHKFYDTANLGSTFEEPRDLALANGPMPRSLPKEVPPALQAIRGLRGSEAR